MTTKAEQMDLRIIKTELKTITVELKATVGPAELETRAELQIMMEQESTVELETLAELDTTREDLKQREETV